MSAVAAVCADPAIIAGRELPRLLGKPISSIVVLNGRGAAIPFQIDEVTKEGEYVLDMGESPNAGDGNGVLDEQDEIAFLWDDADTVGADGGVEGAWAVTLSRGSERRVVYAAVDSGRSVRRSTKRYIDYNHAAGRVATPYYYAEFAKDRFHFVRAGVRDGASGGYVDLAGELRVEILLTTLFGLVPIRYGEGDLFCFVRRYKAGPIRLIRRGDFHLNLGLGVRGSRAAVNQICYPRAVGVPVYVHLPIRFRALFSRAHIEMTPEVRDAGRGFVFSVPSAGLSFPVVGGDVDTLSLTAPLNKMYTLKRGAVGYGWLLNTTMDAAHIAGSGFVMRRPGAKPGALAECGFRLSVRDVPRGNYYITNWVLFPGGQPGDLERLSKTIGMPIIVNSEK